MGEMTPFMEALKIGAERAGVQLPTWQQVKSNGREPKQVSGAEAPVAKEIEQRISEFAALSQEQRTAGALRNLFSSLAQLDEFDLARIKPQACKAAELKVRDFDRMLKVARAAHAAVITSAEIIEGKYPIISPALDFFDGVGCVTVPLAVQGPDRVEYQPYLVTNSRELIPVGDGQLVTIGDRQVILGEPPAALGSFSRLAHPHIKTFLAGYTPEPVSVFRAVVSLFDRYIDFEHASTALVFALWVIGTYLYSLFDAFPYLALMGPKGSGKTKTLNLLEKVAFNCRVSSSLSAASLFRIIQATRATLGIDEGERLARRDDPVAGDLRLLLNSGYKRGSPALRVEGDKDRREVKEFQVYAPKAIASISGLEDVLGSRCVLITMLRTRSEKGNLSITERGEDWPRIRHELYSFALCFYATIRQIYESDTSVRVLSNRDNELWLPLLAIAKFLELSGEESLLDSIKAYAQAATAQNEGSGLSEEEQALLRALIELTRGKVEGEFTPKQVREAMGNFLEPEEHIDIKTQWVGYALKRFGFIRHRKRQGSSYRVTAETARDLAERYGVTAPDSEKQGDPV